MNTAKPAATGPKMAPSKAKKPHRDVNLGIRHTRWNGDKFHENKNNGGADPGSHDGTN
jgi:hypothetical protein